MSFKASLREMYFRELDVPEGLSSARLESSKMQNLHRICTVNGLLGRSSLDAFVISSRHGESSLFLELRTLDIYCHLFYGDSPFEKF